MRTESTTAAPAATITRLYRDLYRIRRVEEEIARVYPTDCIQSPVHLSIGQESASVGVCAALSPGDVVYGTYRSHAMYLAKGGDLRQMIAELYGKATGCAKGKGGSMHLVDAEHGVMGTSAVVGTTIPLAVGHSLAFRMQRSDRLVASFFGDGATEEGVFHESLNFAAIKQLPIIFVCENNFYAIHTPQSARQPGAGSVTERASSYGIRAERVTDGDVLSIYQRVQSVVLEFRSGKPGPYFLEIHSYRWKEHVGPNDDYHFGYRQHEEAQPWKDRDQIARLGAMLEGSTRRDLEAAVEAEIEDAFQFAVQSPVPAPEELYTDML